MSRSLPRTPHRAPSARRAAAADAIAPIPTGLARHAVRSAPDPAPGGGVHHPASLAAILPAPRCDLVRPRR